MHNIIILLYTYNKFCFIYRFYANNNKSMLNEKNNGNSV